jgi:hypothetical protein
VSNFILRNYTIGIISLISFSQVALPLFFIFSAVGFGVGVCGSALAIKNYLRV